MRFLSALVVAARCIGTRRIRGWGWSSMLDAVSARLVRGGKGEGSHYLEMITSVGCVRCGCVRRVGRVDRSLLLAGCARSVRALTARGGVV